MRTEQDKKYTDSEAGTAFHSQHILLSQEENGGRNLLPQPHGAACAADVGLAGDVLA